TADLFFTRFLNATTLNHVGRFYLRRVLLTCRRLPFESSSSESSDDSSFSISESDDDVPTTPSFLSASAPAAPRPVRCASSHVDHLPHYHHLSVSDRFP